MLVLLPAVLEAQSDPGYPGNRYTTEQHLLHGIDSLYALDTSLEDFHLFLPTHLNNYGVLDLGNSGTAVLPARFGANSPRGFDPGWRYLDPYLLQSNEDSRYYRTVKPLTSLFYRQGATKLLSMDALHSQNIRPNWNFGVEFRRLTEDGFYLRQVTSSFRTRFFTWYHTPDYRYHLMASSTWNRFNNQESGGLYSAASFDTLQGPVRNPLVKYYASQNVRNILRSNVYSVTQIYRLGPSRYFPGNQSDSMGRPLPDTIATFIPSAQISLRMRLETATNLFSIDNLAGLPFENFYRDSVATYDSTRYRNLELSLGYESGPYRELRSDSLHPREKRLFYGVWMDVNRIKMGWLGDYAQYTNLSVRGELAHRSWFTRREGVRISGYHFIRGYNRNDRELRVEAGRNLFRFLKLEALALSRVNRPDFLSYYYFGNHDYWKNSFRSRSLNQFQVSLSDPGIRRWWTLAFSAYDLNNYVFYNAAHQPEQSTEKLRVMQTEFILRLTWRWLNFRSSFLHQSLPNTGIIRLPELAVKSSLFAEGMMFKKALKAKAGIDFFWTSAFESPAWYAPARLWYNAEGDESQIIGNYPYFNVFVTGQLKTLTFFVMFQHISQGLFGPAYYTSALYPMQPRSLRLGIRWMLYE